MKLRTGIALTLGLALGLGLHAIAGAASSTRVGDFALLDHEGRHH